MKKDTLIGISLWSFGLLLLLASACQSEAIPEIWISGIVKDSIKNRTKYPYQLRYKAGFDDFEVPAVLNRRGGMSFIYKKYSYTLELDRKIPLGFLPMDNDWVLNASYIDKTFLRHKISYDLYRQMDDRNIAAQSNYVRLYYNEVYEGLYVLMEKLDASTLFLNKKDEQAAIFKDPPLFQADSVTVVGDSSNFFEQKFPLPSERDKNPELRRLKQFLFHASDEAFRRDIPRLFDLPNIIDWHLLLLLTNNSDGILKNFYLYKPNTNTPFRIAIWDYDHSFGRDGDNELNLIRPLKPQRSVLLRRLLELDVDHYQCRLTQRWKDLRERKLFSIPHLKQMMEQNLRRIRTELPKNAERWPLNHYWYYDKNDAQQEVEIMEKYLQQRFPQIEAQIEEWAKTCKN